MTVTKQIFLCDRRDLLKWGAYGAAGFLMCDFDTMLAAGECEQPPAMLPPREVAGELLYWIDGPFSRTLGANQTTRARLAAYLDLTQSAGSYVEAVSLVDDQQQVIASRRLTADDKTSQGKVPYIIFDHLALDHTKAYSLVYIVRKSATEALVYRFVIAKENIRESRFDFSHLSPQALTKVSQQLLNDVKTAEHRFVNDTPVGIGHITTPFQHFADLSFGGGMGHSVRAKMKSLGTTGDFEVAVELMHGDDNDGHYMRYFLVLDPVGRILGGVKRLTPSEQSARATEKDGPGIVRDGNAVIVRRGMVGETQGFDAEMAGINGRSILDCPYVQIVTEDKRDALARMTLRLR